ncbi:MAG: sodium:solute symporter [Flavobacteriales bacterium]|nr:sodium:solute symporter [Flavobacteriales bacterium]
MSFFTILSIIIVYFLVLLLISYLTSKQSDSSTFFTGNKKSPWLVVAYGMIGAALSGVTFVSLPGNVYSNGFYFGQFILGNIVGYLIITFVLIPLYYRYNLVSIYSYLERRFGFYSYKTGALVFILSQSFGAALRMLLAVIVLRELFSGEVGMYFSDDSLVPLWILAFIFIALIFLYTYKSGIKTIVWTDMFQTTFLLLTAIFVIYTIFNKMDISVAEAFSLGAEKGYTKFINLDFASGDYFGKKFLSGILIAIAMMGLDQNMMQKSLTIKNVKDAQKNTLMFSISVAIAQFFFLFLGMMLFLYIDYAGISESLPMRDGKVITDRVFPFLAVTHAQFGATTTVLFVLGILAAAFSSADSALASLTTSFCYDFLGMDKKELNVKVRHKVHIGFSIFLFFIVFVFSFAGSNVINLIFSTAGYTYSPLLALFFLGILTKVKIWDISTPFACVLAPITTYFLVEYMKNHHDFDLGFLNILFGALFTLFYLGIFSLLKRKNDKNH